MAELTRTKFWFLRHGETDWNTRRLTQGNVEVELNEIGLRQARDAAMRLKTHGDIASIVASPVGRALQTVEIVAGVLGLPFTTDADLREASFGEQEGQIMGDWYDDWVTGDYTPKGAESFAQLSERVIPAMNRALARPATVLIVAHGGMFRAVRAAMGLTPKQRTANGIPLLCTPADPAWRVVEG